MGYLPQFEHDIFLSYTHRDDVPPPRAEAGWVTFFSQALRAALSQKLDGGPPDVWMDQRLAENAQLGPELDTRLQRSAILLIILSPPYLTSEWCRKERGAFLRGASGRAKSSVFIVEKDRVGQRPSELEDFVGRRFWKEEPNDPDITVTFGWPVPSLDDGSYWSLINALAAKLSKCLRDLGSQLREQEGSVGAPASVILAPRPPRASDAAAPVVILAQATDDLFDERMQVSEYLERAGISVIPEAEYPIEPDAVGGLLQHLMPKARLFAQLLGPQPGRRSENQPLGLPGLQHAVAKQWGIPILQWRDPLLDMESTDAAYRVLLDGSTVRACGLEEFKAAVVKAARAGPQSPRPDGPGVGPDGPRGGGPPSGPSGPGDRDPAPRRDRRALVMVSALPQDAVDAQNVARWLLSQDIDVIQWVDKGGEAGDVQRFAEMSTVASAFIVVYGTSTDQRWVAFQLLLARKYGGQRGPSISLAVGPEETTLNFSGVRYLDSRMLNETALQPYLSQLAG